MTTPCGSLLISPCWGASPLCPRDRWRCRHCHQQWACRRSGNISGQAPGPWNVQNIVVHDLALMVSSSITLIFLKSFSSSLLLTLAALQSSSSTVIPFIFSRGFFRRTSSLSDHFYKQFAFWELVSLSLLCRSLPWNKRLLAWSPLMPDIAQNIIISYSRINPPSSL